MSEFSKFISACKTIKVYLFLIILLIVMFFYNLIQFRIRLNKYLYESNQRHEQFIKSLDSLIEK